MKRAYYLLVPVISLALAVPLAAGILWVLPIPPAPLKGLAFTAERRPNTYRFDPKPDITTYELAQIIGQIFGNADYVPAIEPYIKSSPSNVQRHWLPPVPSAEPLHEREHEH